jgi:multimeric flavodoxin WrbA
VFHNNLATGFISAMNRHGGHESTVPSLNNVLHH